MSYSKCALMALLALALSACDTMPVRGNASIPASLLVKCEPLNKLEGVTGADMLKNIVRNAEVYYACSDAHERLIEAVKPDKK